MSLRDELLGIEPDSSDLTFRLALPPGWRMFSVDDAGKAALLALVRDRGKAAGRPDIDAHVRSIAAKQFHELQRRDGIALYLPGEVSSSAALPMSLVATRWRRAPSVDDFARDVRTRAAAEVDEIALASGVVFRWEKRGGTVPGQEGVTSRETSYVFPEPSDEPRRGVLLTSSIIVPDGIAADTVGLFAGMHALSDAIAETFHWMTRGMT